MKTTLLRLSPLLLFLTIRAAGPSGLVAHEWGTFTTLSGSDGQALSWYLPTPDAVPLPAFVHSDRMLGSKSVGLAAVRMETPVVYFYARAPMAVQVEARLQGGRVTEWFPGGAATSNRFAFGVGSLGPDAGRLRIPGELIPPTDAAALATVPRTHGSNDTHYVHARAVPDAWLFRSHPDAGRAPETEHFLFYRGKGNVCPPFRAWIDAASRFHLGHAGRAGGIRGAIALAVQGGTVRWARLPDLAAATDNPDDPWSAGVSGTVPAEGMDADQAAKQLTAALVPDLVSAGLTGAEAKAMVATWEGLWFREPGDRILAILPRQSVDELLPLTVSPLPDKLERVFVQRFELLSPARESRLAALLESPRADRPGAGEHAEFAALQLDRFAEGALQRVLAIQANRSRFRFHALSQPAAPTVSPETAGTKKPGPAGPGFALE